MSIAENIALFRKQRGFTQEQLGTMLGVTNQAVSKWESSVSLPDVLLLPKIAEVLEITLNELYGIEIPEAKEFPDSPKKVQQNVKDTFCRSVCPPSLLEFLCSESEGQMHLKRGISVGWVSPTEGALYMTEDAILLDIMSPDISVLEDVSSVVHFKKLTDHHVRKVLSCFGKDLIPEPTNVDHPEFYDVPLSLVDIMQTCSLNEEEATDVLDKLMVLHFIERNPDNGGYLLHKAKVVYAITLFRAISRMVHADFAWGCPNLTALRIGFIEQ